MNIKEAKNQIRNTLRAYLQKDELGNYAISQVRQRPVLLMGPPGIGKTQIMEQIASEEGVGLVSYTITHHTRQSAIGLPVIEKREFEGETFSVTEYTMSEILGSVYELMEKTGLREGILFLDEINCVSETLAPMMLQFLQCKTFGNRKLPEGWLIVAAGNPPEYNRSVRDFDVVTLDRVKRINVEADYGVWREYALAKNLHGAVISYLDGKKENFCRMENTADGLQFATARGWEDLSEILCVYDKMGIPADKNVVEQYIQMPSVARDFAEYLSLYEKYRRAYRVDGILEGEWPRTAETELKNAPFDEKLAVMNLLYTRIAQAAKDALAQDLLTEDLYEDLLDIKNGAENLLPDAAAAQAAERAFGNIKKMTAAGQMDRDLQDRELRRANALTEYADILRKENVDGTEQQLNRLRELFGLQTERRLAAIDHTGAMLDNAFRFLENAVGQCAEMVFFLTELTAGAHTAKYIADFGCDAYYRNNSGLLVENTRRNIVKKITENREKL